MIRRMRPARSPRPPAPKPRRRLTRRVGLAAPLAVLAAAPLGVLAAGPAWSGPDRLLGERAPSLVRPDGSARAGGSQAPRRRSLEAMAAERRLEAADTIRAIDREGERQMEALDLRPDASPERVEQVAERWRREAQEDALQTAVDLDALERRAGRPLGPVTRYLLSTRLRPARSARAADREDEVETLRRAAEARERAAGPAILEVPKPPEPGTLR